MQSFRVVIVEGWPFFGALLILGWAVLGFVSQ
jgi:hypothetical protein